MTKQRRFFSRLVVSLGKSALTGKDYRVMARYYEEMQGQCNARIHLSPNVYFSNNSASAEQEASSKVSRSSKYLDVQGKYPDVRGCFGNGEMI